MYQQMVLKNALFAVFYDLDTTSGTDLRFNARAQELARKNPIELVWNFFKISPAKILPTKCQL